MVREALVVGINNYRSNDLPQLQAPARDAELIAQRLEAQGFWTVRRLPEGQRKSGRAIVSRFDDALVTVRELEAAIEDLFYPQTERQKPDAALLYFSGHGLRKVGRRRTAGFLAASDVNLDGDRWGLSLKWLRELLQDSAIASQVVWLDCCHSGELLNFEEGNPGEQGQARDRCFIAASQDHEVAYEALDEPYSELTRVLWRGLDGSAGDVNSFDLQQFVDEAFGQRTQKRQRPLFQTSGGSILLVPGASQPIKEAPAVVREENPYQGLNAFNRETAPFFFGQEAVVQRLWQEIQQSAFVPVIGVSGSGKSSVVRAGLLPSLTERRWRVLEPIKPWTDPLIELKNVLTGLCDAADPDQVKQVAGLVEESGAMAEILVALGLADSGQCWLLVVDQFEEVFTVCASVSQRQRFIELLTGTMAVPDSPLRIVITMRADFVDECLRYGSLTQALQTQAVWMPPLEGQDLEAAIEQPATVQGYGFAPGLLELIVGDVVAEPNALPLLQFALTQLWERRDTEGHRLTVGAYLEMKQLKGALDCHAEAIYGQLKSEQDQDWARRVCLKLVRTGTDAKDTRQRQPQQTLLGMGQTDEERQIIERVINRLVNGRLLVRGSGEPTPSPSQEENRRDPRVLEEPWDLAGAWIDLAHESLMAGWKQFAEWRLDNRDLRRLADRVEDGQKEWADKGQDENYFLPTGLMLEVRDAWGKLEAEKLLSTEAQLYYQKSLQHNQEKVAFIERNLTELELREEAMQILNLTSARPLPDTAARAIKAVGTSHNTLNGDVLTPLQTDLQAVIAKIKASNCFQGHSDSVWSVAFSPDGKTIVSGSSDQTVRLWDLSGNPMGEPFQGHSDYVRSVAFSPDGKTIVSGSYDQTVRLWDLSGNPMGEPFQGHSASVSSVAFSPDGKTIVSGSSDQTVRLWLGSWQSWLALCCNRLRYHPIFKDPPDEVAREACEVCQRLVWNKEF